MVSYQELVLDNFISKTTSLSLCTKGVKVQENQHFITIDSGFPSDTFNVLVPLRTLPSTSEDKFKQAVSSFINKGFPLSVWIDERFLTDETVVWLYNLGLNEAERNVTMKLDDKSIQSISPLSSNLLDIRQVTDVEDIRIYAEVFQSLFKGSSEYEALALFFENLAANFVPHQKVYNWFIGFYEEQAVSTGCIIESDGSYGIYDVMTKQEFRGRGFGSMMFQFLLHQIKGEQKGKPCVLQASQDGINIYKRAGFTEVGEMVVFE
ncbi:GNAT family N-acetyltransferase [Heyndrickxia sp. NPDC080065]|uniref:GNAT family N-acetyltransferase n=1 Tax=Heyndrickxia sp. NPDC080065 TaxID=3390568 RepID=UPI003D05D136